VKFHFRAFRFSPNSVWAAKSLFLGISGVLFLLISVSFTAAAEKHAQVREGTLEIDFDSKVLEGLGISLFSAGTTAGSSDGPVFRFEIDQELTSLSTVSGNKGQSFMTGTAASCGALLLAGLDERFVIGNLVLRGDEFGAQVLSTLDESRDANLIFDVVPEALTYEGRGRELTWEGELFLSENWARQLGIPSATGTRLGRIQLRASFGSAASNCIEPSLVAERSTGEGEVAEAYGSDVIVADLQTIARYTPYGNISAYAIGTTACNLGNQRADWISYTNQHPVIVQGMYRLKDDRFQQIGMAWVKHGFYAVSEEYCGRCLDQTDGSALGIGCSDPYSAGLNGVQSNMSPRSTVNAHTGYFPYPWYGPPTQNSVERRLEVHSSDLDPAQNPSARYFIEGHYIHPDDCLVGTQDNNASYREVFVSQISPGNYNVSINLSRPTQQGQPAIRAWRDFDPGVVETDVRVPGEGLFFVAVKATALNNGYWRYAYAIQNLNSDRSGQSWTVQLPSGATVTNTQFFDVDYHSGEPYAQDPWTMVSTSESVSWHTDTYDVNPNANALRFDTIYTFSFDCNVEPGAGKAVLGLFKPGLPDSVPVLALGPRLALIDCNHNGIDDQCDIDCAALGCVPPCGGSSDCNSNDVPDECEPDCNGNGIADDCDVANCPPGETWCGDCNNNQVPDICESDCDHDGIIDDCETNTDCDNDGVDDCDDLCPCTTPEDACLPPYSAIVVCCFPNGLFIVNLLTLQQCINIGGGPVCDDPPQCPGTPCPMWSCRNGCLLGDADGDGDVDLADAGGMQRCFGDGDGDGDGRSPEVWAECLRVFDFNEDGVIGTIDYKAFQQRCAGPRQ